MTTACALKDTVISGYDGIEITNGLLSLKVVPQIGGKIFSIFHAASEREWLAQNPYLPLRIPPYDSAFVEAYDSGGLDECFPSIAPIRFPIEPWQQSCVPDHGELWCQSWDVEIVAAAAEQVVLSMVCFGVRLPYRFERRLTMTAGSSVVGLDYSVTSLSSFDMPFVWSIHPILNIEAGMRLVLPDTVRTARIDGTLDDAFVGKAGSRCSWPVLENWGRFVDLSRVPPADLGQAVKLYMKMAGGEGVVETAVIDPINQHKFGFRFKPDEVTHFGMWLNYGGWSGCGSAPYYNLGFEPCIGGADSLINAMQLDEYAILRAKKTRQWSLEMFVD